MENRYIVLPRIVLEHLPVALQHEVVGLLSRIHDVAAELRELGIIAELDWNGDLIHRDENTGRPLTADQLAHPLSESCQDLLYP